MLTVIMLTVIMLTVIMLTVIMLTVIMLNVPHKNCYKSPYLHKRHKCMAIFSNIYWQAVNLWL
jgi:hypothetical protein